MGKQTATNRHDFLLTLFPNQDKTKLDFELNGFILSRFFDGNQDRWVVGIYTKESYQKHKGWTIKDSKG